MRRFLVRVLPALALAIAAAACTTPTIPIPPPSPDDMHFMVEAGAGTASYASDPRPEYALARVSVYDRTSGEGVIATAEADGSVTGTRPFPAALGDEVEVTIDIDDDRAGICVVLREGTLSDADRCTE